VKKLKYATIVEEAKKILRQYNVTMTLRQLYYRLVAKLILANTMNNYKALSKWMVKARERGDINEAYIEDRVRQTFGGDSGYESPDGFIKSYEDWFRGCWDNFAYNMWTTQPQALELWVEKDALSRLVSEEGDKFNVVTCPSRGYSSYSYVRKGVRRINRHGKHVKVLYLGDFDPSGMDIERDLLDRLIRYGAEDMEVQRIALTLEQIREYDLPPMPAKTSDPRLAAFQADTGGSDAVELDALEPPVLQQLINDAIVAEIDQDAWDKRLTETEEEKQRLKEKLAGVEITYEDEA